MEKSETVMTDTTDERLAFPREIWMGDRYEHDQGMLRVRAAQDEDHDHRYVDADIYDSAEKYWRARAEAAEAETEELGEVVVKLHNRIQKQRGQIKTAEAERDALAAKLALAVEGLKASEAEIDGYILDEYPFGHPSLDRYRKRDYDANPARIALAQLTADTPKEGKDDE